MRPHKRVLVGLKLDDLDITTLHYAGMASRLLEASKVYCVHVVEIPGPPEKARGLHLELGSVPTTLSDLSFGRVGCDYRERRMVSQPGGPSSTGFLEGRDKQPED